MSEKTIVTVGEAKFELLPGFDQLRKCSFRPQDHLILVRFEGREEQALYLEVKWRLIWLQTYCEELNLSYAVIEEEPKQIGNDITSVCKVLINDKLVGQGTGGMRADSLYAIQQAATIAKGRALANAGFGSVFTSASESESGGIEIPCDSGVSADFFVFQPQKLDPSYGNPMQVPAPPPLQSDAPAMPANPRYDNQQFIPRPQTAPEPPARQATQTPVSAECPRTREDALSFLVPLRGTWYGKPLSEVIAKDPASVRYYAEKSRNGDLKQAARLILNLI